MGSLGALAAPTEALPTSPLWIFGYGSLVWRPAFQFSHKQPGYIKGYKRRFWQGSTDHRGVPAAPGRVVTLVSKTEGDYNHPLEQLLLNDREAHTHGSQDAVWGVCYEIPVERIQETLNYLDVREQGGYTRSLVDVFAHPSEEEPILKDVLLYTATTENAEYLGPAPMKDIALQIFKSVGPSGPNIEYLSELHHALLQSNIHDHHIGELYQLIQQLLQAEKESTQTPSS